MVCLPPDFLGMTPLTPPLDDSTTPTKPPRYARLISLRCQVPQRFSRKRWKVLGCLSWAAPTGPEGPGVPWGGYGRGVAGVFFLKGVQVLLLLVFGEMYCITIGDRG